MIVKLRNHFQGRAHAMLVGLEDRLDDIARIWLFVAALACAARIYWSPIASADVGTLTPYAFLIIAPLASLLLALRFFTGRDEQRQPALRIARIGRWRSVPEAEARRNPLFGAGGIMVSLLIGMLLNIPVRTAEYLVAIPALAGTVPAWLQTLHLALTIDVVLFTSLYAVAFVAALRHAPVFPRLLAMVWIADLGMQLVIAEMVSGTNGLPASVAAPLHALLEGNMTKVLISVGLWLPYLLLSKRVNVTYRNRIPR